MHGSGGGGYATICSLYGRNSATFLPISRPSSIAVRLTVGIYDRKAATRATLYALRGAFAAGDTERALDFLQRYANRRLLGDHVPYPIEWGPEGTQPHLAAESALYCRVFTEGLFGIRPRPVICRQECHLFLILKTMCIAGNNAYSIGADCFSRQPWARRSSSSIS